jgi:hypothetical protein
VWYEKLNQNAAFRNGVVRYYFHRKRVIGSHRSRLLLKPNNNGHGRKAGFPSKKETNPSGVNEVVIRTRDERTKNGELSRVRAHMRRRGAHAWRVGFPRHIQRRSARGLLAASAS